MEFHQTFKLTFASIFIVLGLFGSIQLILIFCRNKEIRTKTGTLFFLNACFHLLCLLIRTEIVSIFGFIPQALCWSLSTLNVTSLMLQLFTTMIMSFDLLLNVMAPLRYRLVAMYNFTYTIIALLGLPILFSVYLHATGSQITGGYIQCVQSKNLSPEMKSLRMDVSYAVLLVTLFIYIISILLLKKRVIVSKSTHRHALKCTIIIVSSFIVSCMIGFTIEMILEKFIELPAEQRSTISGYVGLHILLCYSQNFNICIWQSSLYRNAFVSNVKGILCFGKIKLYTKNSVASIGSFDDKKASHSTLAHVI